MNITPTVDIFFEWSGGREVSRLNFFIHGKNAQKPALQQRYKGVGGKREIGSREGEQSIYPTS
jgi:hypothetical protein